MTQLAGLPLHDLLDLIAAPTPTPGGGAVAAVGGACGTALAEMVSALPRTRLGTHAEREELDRARPALRARRARLEALAELDRAAFDQVIDRRRLPRRTEAEQAIRHREIAEAMRGATLVPLETAEVCVEVLTLMAPLARAGHRAAASDVRVAISMLRAAVEGAAANVRANLESLDDGDFAVSASARLDAVVGQLETSVEAAMAALGA